MEMRELTALDVFKILPIINKTGAIKVVKNVLTEDSVKEMLKQFRDEQENNGSEQENNADSAFESIGIRVMADVADHVLGNIGKAEKEINGLLASLTGKTIEDIETLPIVEYTALVINFFRKEELTGFLERIKPLL